MKRSNEKDNSRNSGTTSAAGKWILWMVCRITFIASDTRSRDASHRPGSAAAKHNNGACGNANPRAHGRFDRLKRAKSGSRFTVSLETNLRVGKTTVAPGGTTVHGHLIYASSPGRIAGRSVLTIELTDIVIDGTAYPLLTNTYEIKGSGEGKHTTRDVIGGTGLGALIGGLAGGGKGAVIGALPAPRAGRPAQLLRRGSRSRFQVNHWWNSGSVSRHPYRRRNKRAGWDSHFRSKSE